MYGSMMLQNISNCAAMAASVYPQLIRLMDHAGVPPDERAAVLAYILQVIDADVTPVTKLN